MPINHCSKCGQEFETKNPKRIVCPNCLYLDRAAAPSIAPPPRRSPEPQQGGYGPPQQQGYGPPRQGGYGPPQQQGGYGPPRQGGYGPPQQQGGYGPPRQGGFGPPRRGPGGGPPQRGGFQRGGPPQRGGFQRGGPPQRNNRPQRQLLVPKEVLAEIEKHYKAMLPLPNPDAHVKIAEILNLEPNKVFFGINLIRQKMKLPKLEYPKRPLAVTPDQLTAVQALYEPFLPVPPIGVHKILAKQLRMEEWRVHVAIGLIRKQMAMPRWNEEREDLPNQMKEQIAASQDEAPAEEAAPQKPASKKKKETKSKEDS